MYCRKSQVVRPYVSIQADSQDCKHQLVVAGAAYTGEVIYSVHLWVRDIVAVVGAAVGAFLEERY